MQGVFAFLWLSCLVRLRGSQSMLLDQSIERHTRHAQLACRGGHIVGIPLQRLAHEQFLHLAARFLERQKAAIGMKGKNGVLVHKLYRMDTVWMSAECRDK